MDSAGEPNSKADLIKTKCKEEVQVRYKGVTPTKLGKFVAAIRDPKRTNGKTWLGTYSSAIEAAKAYDKAAFKFHGSNATLNFPLSPVGSNENAKGERFIWTDEVLALMCDILNKHLAKNGPNSPFQWKEHMLEFQKISNHNFKVLTSFRRKYAEMKQSYNLWKSLKSENGMRWDERTGKLDCSDDCWDKKIRENPRYVIFRNKQPSKELQEAWDQLFGNVAANEVDRVGRSVGTGPSNKIRLINLDGYDDEDGDDDDDDDDDDDGDGSSSESERTLHSSQFGNQETEKATPFSTEVRQEGILTPTHCNGYDPFAKPSTKPGPSGSSSMKREMRESDSATRFKESAPYQNATQERALKVLKTSSVNQVGNSSISAAISVINSMVDDGLMVSCSEFWCFAVTLCEDDVKRDLLLSLPDNVGRLAWLHYKQNVAQ